MRFTKVLLFASFLAAGFGLSVVSAQPAAAPAASPAANFSVATASSSVTYEVIHKLHKVRGTSKKVEGKARILPDGKAQVMVRVPVDSFDSQNVNRDAHVKEVVEAARYPTVDIKATAEGIALPATFPSTVEKTFTAEVSFHGVKKQLQVPVKLSFDSADKVHATASLNVSFDEFKVERPSLMFVKVDDAIKIEADLILNKG